MKEVLLPSLGADMTEGTIVKWLKGEGDAVARGDKLAEIETDKTIVEMEAYHGGFLRRILAGEGTRAPVGTTIALIGEEDEAIPDDLPQGGAAPAEAPAAEAEPAAEAAEAAPAEAAAAPSESGGKVKASPIARRLAKERGVDLSQIQGTGPGGRVSKSDVLNFAPGGGGGGGAPQMASAGGAPRATLQAGEEAVSSMRKAIAATTLRSKTTTPHFYVTNAIDMTAAVEWRGMVNAALEEGGGGGKISVNDLVLMGSVKALLKHPKWNSSYEDGVMRTYGDINLGVAIALEEGLMVPAIMRAQGMDLFELSAAAKDLGRRTRGRKNTQEEITQGTFSTSNLGMFGTDTFAAIILPPQAAMLAVGAVKATPVVRNGAVEVRQMMNATIAADHRVGDGAEAAAFMAEFQSCLENPAKLLLLN